MRVAYITYPFFLDFSIEYINELKKAVQLDVYIVLTRIHLKSTILNASKYNFQTGELVSLERLENILENYNLIKQYANGCNSFNFILFPDKSLSLASVITSKKFAKIINGSKPAIIHFDDTITHFLGLKLFLKGSNILTNIHDPEPHSNAKDWRRDLTRKVLFPKMKSFILFSEFSTNRFIEIYKPRQKVHTLSLVPYNFYTKLNPKEIYNNIKPNDFVVLFFGRISKYKGINQLFNSFNNLYQKLPNLKVIIAGKGSIEYDFPENLKNEIDKRLIIINRFITNEELVQLMQITNIVVCPYLDATQSGVVMTAFAFQKKVIATRVGGLHEPIIENKNGFTYSLDNENGLDTIIENLVNNKTGTQEFILKQEYQSHFNTKKLIEIYRQLIEN
ncbi:MAG: glycosyltransferase [Mucilaginibacter sp.]|nr:glycosyltransferase [Mucilaginibacter sp.]